MLFSSTTFIYVFLPVVLVLYYCVFKRSRLLQNLLLLLSSLFFYAWGEPKYVLIMIVSITINWGFGLLVSRNKKKSSVCKMLICIDVIFNLGLLFVFKYLGFTASVVKQIFDLEYAIPSIALPIGISFFTFQSLSYVLDVYREKGEVQTNILYVGLYISFFPQLIAGPIVRYENVAEEIRNRKETVDDFFDGFARFVVGLSKKVLLANVFALLADLVFEQSKSGVSVSVLFSWLGAISYTFQIFFDFSGYSDMAIGLGRMFGFHFLENFNYPYISTSITEFWRRWHMSLGTWFRDYLYFPLGGSRVGKWRNIVNLFVVWLATGVWHGANFTFVLWGLLYFALLVFEKMTNFHKVKNKGIMIFKWIYTMFFVILGWVLFRAESVSDAWVYIKSMLGMNNNVFIDGMFAGYALQYLMIIIVGVLLSTPLFRIIKDRTKGNAVVDYLSVLGLFILFVLSVASLVSSSYNPFIYFNF